MSFTSEDVGDEDIPPHPYFTVKHYIERVRALGLALALVAAIIAYTDPMFAAFLGTKGQQAALGIITTFDSLNHATMTAFAAWVSL